MQLIACEVEYRDVPGCPGYRVGNDGSVWSCKVMGSRFKLRADYRKLRPAIINGYLNYGICVDGKQKTRSGHVLVLTAFVGPCPEGMEGCHNDGDRSNNRLENLRWDTPKNNQRDRLIHGTSSRGEKNPKAKLTIQQVRVIRQRLASGASRKAIMAEYQIGETTVGRLANGIGWEDNDGGRA